MTGDTGGTDVLIVDNDERIVELVAWFLEKRGYQVRSAHSFDQAREALLERRPALMLSDVDLGAQSAREELPRLAQEGLLPPTLVVSGYLDANLRTELMAIGPVLDTLAKPFDFPALEERILACLALASEAAPGTGPSKGPGSDPEDLEDEDGWIEIRPQAHSANPGPSAPSHSRVEERPRL